MKRLVVASALGMAMAILATIGLLVAGAGRGASDSAAETPSPEIAREAARLRAMGPVGLTAAFKRQADLNMSGDRAAALRDWKALVDAVAGQRDAWASRLYWYTDLEVAKSAAAKAGKPILSLRLLGRLTDEHSCANSRYFRKTLYPSAAVGDFLRENFVLHWESVRPVPTVTIDFGDGRKLKRTITGNSVHYVLDCHGRLVDALPGLYGPEQFLSLLGPAQEAAARCGALASPHYCRQVTEYHQRQRSDADARLKQDLELLGPKAGRLSGAAELLARVPPELVIEFPTGQSPATPADIVPRVAVRRDVIYSADPLPDPNWRIWSALATRHFEHLQADDEAMRVVAPGLRRAERANRVALPKFDVEAPLVANIALMEFSRNRAIDGVYNEFALHYRIHEYLSNTEPLKLPLADFTRWCYAEVFLSPLDDPWYGLKSDAYDGYDPPPEKQTAQVAREAN
ncbi:MAG: hypothetical protein K2Y37_04315 [Pirellulales bacterium]|nr:hypothetical protein [Pirellulales bacterium]